MKAIAYSIKSYEKEFLIKANEKKHDITVISNRLNSETISFAEGKDAIIVFTGDDVSGPVIQKLHAMGIKYIATRSTGTDHIDMEEAKRLGIKVANVPSYSPESIAEHTVMLMLSLNRRVLEFEKTTEKFSFKPSRVIGTTLHGKTVGIVGFGEIGKALAPILLGFGAEVLVNDQRDVSDSCKPFNLQQVDFEELLKRSDIISFHVPLTTRTHHLVNKKALELMKDGVMLINVSRGGIFDADVIFEGLESGKISSIGLDVYEYENGLSMEDSLNNEEKNLLIQKLINHPKIFFTPHQAFLTREALQSIAAQTIQSLDNWNTEKIADTPVLKKVG